MFPGRIIKPGINLVMVRQCALNGSFTLICCSVGLDVYFIVFGTFLDRFLFVSMAGEGECFLFCSNLWIVSAFTERIF